MTFIILIFLACFCVCLTSCKLILSEKIMACVYVSEKFMCQKMITYSYYTKIITMTFSLCVVQMLAVKEVITLISGNKEKNDITNGEIDHCKKILNISVKESVSKKK